MDRDDTALVEETKALIEEVESGDTAHAAWMAIQDRVERLYEGRTQREVGELLGKSQKWVGDVLAWQQDPAKPTPWTGARAETRPNEKTNIAAKVLKDPEQRKQVIESLSDAEVFDLTSDALDVDTERRRETRKASKTERKDQGKESIDRAMWRLTFSHIATAERSIREAIRQARLANWTAAEVERLRARLEKTHELADVLLSIAEGVEDVDWDAELARLMEEAHELEVRDE